MINEYLNYLQEGIVQQRRLIVLKMENDKYVIVNSPLSGGSNAIARCIYFEDINGLLKGKQIECHFSGSFMPKKIIDKGKMLDLCYCSEDSKPNLDSIFSDFEKSKLFNSNKTLIFKHKNKVKFILTIGMLSVIFKYKGTLKLT